MSIKNNINNVYDDAIKSKYCMVKDDVIGTAVQQEDNDMIMQLQSSSRKDTSRLRVCLVNVSAARENAEEQLQFLRRIYETKGVLNIRILERIVIHRLADDVGASTLHRNNEDVSTSPEKKIVANKCLNRVSTLQLSTKDSTKERYTFMDDREKLQEAEYKEKNAIVEEVKSKLAVESALL